MAIWNMCFACWITKATNLNSDYVIIIAFPRQQWLLESNSIFLYTYIACRVSVLPFPPGHQCGILSSSVTRKELVRAQNGARISSGICLSRHMLFDLIAMKIRDEDDQFAEFNERLNFLKNGNFPICGGINMEILKYASPGIKGPFKIQPVVCRCACEVSSMRTVKVAGRIFMKTALINLLNVAYFVNSKILEHRPAVSRQAVLLRSSHYLENMGMAVTGIHIVY
jgi:hypothetical protein